MMFENMTKTEKLLSLVLACMVPIVLLFVAFMWFIGTYNDQDMKIAGLNRMIKQKKDEYDEAQYAKQRRSFYEYTSFPASESEALYAFDEWFNRLADEVGMRIVNRKNPTSTSVLSPVSGTLVGRINGRAISLEGTLDQWVQLVDQFNRNALMKRIAAFKLTPKTIGGNGPNKNARSGKLKIDANFEFFSMRNAAGGELTDAQLALETPLSDYQNLISNRNIFAPANNAPKLSISSTKSAYAGESISFAVSAEDVDEQDELSIELVSCEAEGATLDAKPGSNRATFKSPGLEIGDYKAVFRVTDNGNPSKSSEKSLVIKVTKKPNNQPRMASDSKRFEFYQGDKITMTLKASDRDKDPVTMELLETEIAGATLTNVEGKDEAMFVCDELPEGDYSFEVELKDGKEPRMRSGKPYPTKETVRIKVMPPKFLHAAKTKVGGFVRNKLGEEYAIIDIRSKSEQVELHLNESFELDGSTWKCTALSIENKTLQLEVDGVVKSYRFRNFLIEPFEETKVVEKEAAESKLDASKKPGSTKITTVDQADIDTDKKTSLPGG